MPQLHTGDNTKQVASNEQHAASAATDAPAPDDGSCRRATVLRGSCSSVSHTMQQYKLHSGCSASSLAILASDQLHSNAKIELRVKACSHTRPSAGGHYSAVHLRRLTTLVAWSLIQRRCM